MWDHTSVGRVGMIPEFFTHRVVSRILWPDLSGCIQTLYLLFFSAGMPAQEPGYSLKHYVAILKSCIIIAVSTPVFDSYAALTQLNLPLNQTHTLG